jgi:hypothetical protein
VTVARILGESGLDSEELRAILHPVRYERVRVLPASPIMRRFWAKGIDAMTLGPWVFVDPSVLNGDKARLGRLMVHELVHVRQWSDYGPIGFLRRYLGDYLRGRRSGAGHRMSYWSNRLEVEAREVTKRYT